MITRLYWSPTVTDAETGTSRDLASIVLGGKGNPPWACERRGLAFASHSLVCVTVADTTLIESDAQNRRLSPDLAGSGDAILQVLSAWSRVKTWARATQWRDVDQQYRTVWSDVLSDLGVAVQIPGNTTMIEVMERLLEQTAPSDVLDHLR